MQHKSKQGTFCIDFPKLNFLALMFKKLDDNIIKAVIGTHFYIWKHLYNLRIISKLEF